MPPKRRKTKHVAEKVAAEPAPTSNGSTAEATPDPSNQTATTDPRSNNNDNCETTPAPDAAAKLAERMARLEKLKAMRGESQRLNREDVKAEFRKKQDNPREATKIEKKREKAEKLLEKQKAEMIGKDYERMRSMDYTIEDVERWERRQQEKERNADNQFTDYAQVHAKKYNKLIRELKPNLHEYAEQRAAHTTLNEGPDNAFYRDADSLAYANPDDKPSREAVEKLVEDLKKQEERRAKFSRRRAFDEDDDVTYINERNMQFNKKIARAYDKYTAEIKGNFERGTAL